MRGFRQPVAPANGGTHNHKGSWLCRAGAPARRNNQVQWLWVPLSRGRRWKVSDMPNSHGPLRIGIGGPVGSGKTALMDLLCKTMRESYEIAAITNDIYTKWDAEFLVRSGWLTPDRIAAVETAGAPPTP